MLVRGADVLTNQTNGGLGSQLCLWGLVLLNPDYDKSSAVSYQDPEIVRSLSGFKKALTCGEDVFVSLPLLAQKLLLVFRGGVTWGGKLLEVNVDGTPVLWHHTLPGGRSWPVSDMAKSALRALVGELDTRIKKEASAATFATAELHLLAIAEWLRFIFDDGTLAATPVLSISTTPVASSNRTLHAGALGVEFLQTVGSRPPSKRSTHLQERARAPEAVEAEDESASASRKRKSTSGTKAKGGAQAGNAGHPAKARRSV